MINETDEKQYSKSKEIEEKPVNLTEKANSDSIPQEKKECSKEELVNEEIKQFQKTTKQQKEKEEVESKSSIEKSTLNMVVIGKKEIKQYHSLLQDLCLGTYGNTK